jgi:hypothetical protein
MKKFLQKLNTKKSRSIVLGFALALAFGLGSSFVTAQSSFSTQLDSAANIAQDVISFDRVSRIGSLSIGSTVTNELFDFLECMVVGFDATNNASNAKSCLSVDGSSTFSNILVNQPGYFMENLVVGEGSGSLFTTANQAFEIKDPSPINGSLMTSSLAYYTNGLFAPRDLTTQRGVCADNDGKLFSCEITVDPAGQCGTAAGVMTSTPPTTNLCDVGTPSTVTLSGGWYSWSCTDGGSVASCTARQEIQATTYNWNVGDYGACSAGPTAGQCTGTYTTTGGNYTPPSVFSSCFIADTYVTMADNTTKNIQDVQIGDILKGQTSNNTVLAFHRPTLGEKLLYSYNGGEYFVTAEHPFMTTDGWKAFDPELAVIEHNLDIEIGQLAVGDTLVTENGNVLLETVDTKSDNPDTQLYNFILDGDNTYYADGYLVHNKWEPCTANNGSNTCSSSSQFCIDPYTDLAIANGSGNCSFNCTPGQTWTGSAYCPSGYSAGMYCDSTGNRKCIQDGAGFPSSGGTQTVQCSNAFLQAGNEEASCEGTNAACSWTPGNNAGPSVKTRTVTCEATTGGNTTTVADQYCIDNVGPKPETTTDNGCIVETGTPFTCTTGGWQIDGFSDTCSPIDYEPGTNHIRNETMCAPNNVIPLSGDCLGSGGNNTGTPVAGASVWYCHLSNGWQQVSGSTCDNTNFPDGYIWGQQRVCTTGNPNSSQCSQGTPAPTSPSTANCTDSNNDNHWNCTD